jgi:hypothetical protein
VAADVNVGRHAAQTGSETRDFIRTPQAPRSTEKDLYNIDLGDGHRHISASRTRMMSGTPGPFGDYINREIAKSAGLPRAHE